MFSKTNLLGTLTAFIFIIVMTFSINLISPYREFIQNHSFYPEGLLKTDMSFMYNFIRIGLLAYFLSTIYGMLKIETHSFLSGFKFGLFFALFVQFGSKLSSYANYNIFDFERILVTGLVDIIIIGIVCGLIALIYKSFSSVYLGSYS